MFRFLGYRAVDIRGSRCDPLAREAAHLDTDLIEIGTQAEVTVAAVCRAHELAFTFGTIV